MGFLLTIPPPAPVETKLVLLAPIEPKPPQLPAVIPPQPLAVRAPKAPRVPLAIRLDNALQPMWRLGIGIFFVSTAIPFAVCGIGGAVAAMTGGNAKAWWDVLSLVSPLGTIGIPSVMIMVRVAADVARAKRR